MLLKKYFTLYGLEFGDGSEYGVEFVMSISVHVGYLRYIWEDWAVSVNLLYNTMGITRAFYRLVVDV